VSTRVSTRGICDCSVETSILLNKKSNDGITISAMGVKTTPSPKNL